MQLWLFASPVAYPIATVPPRWRNVYATVNPVVGPIDSFRRLAAGRAPEAALLVCSLVGSALFMLVGGMIFRVLQRDLADVV
jgi:ABC-type polysaccharide/polyol phosphate export permease